LPSQTVLGIYLTARDCSLSSTRNRHNNSLMTNLERNNIMKKPFPFIRLLLASACLSTLLPAQAQTSQVLQSLVTNHGSLAAGDVVFTNFRMPRIFPGSVIQLGDTFPAAPNGADVSVRASVGADGQINLVLTPIDPATGLPKPFLTDATPGAPLPTDALKYVEYDVVVTNPLRRLHALDHAFGPGTTGVMGSTPFNFTYVFDETHSNPLTQYLPVAIELIAGGAEIYPAGPTTLPGGDRAGARFGTEWGISANDWGGIRQGTGSLDSITVRYALADAVAPVAVAPVGVSILFTDAVYLSSPAPVGGVTIALSVNDPTALAVPATVTVPEGSFYSSIRSVKQPVQTIANVYVSGIYNGVTTEGAAMEWVFVGDAVGPGPVPTLSVTLNGKGKVINTNKTLNCGTVCSIIPPGGVLNGWSETLVATAGSGSTFTGWTGACSGTEPTCRVIVGGLVNVGATFTAIPSAGGGGGGGGGTTTPPAPAGNLTLKVATSNPGTVTSNVGGINCGSACSASVAAGTAVTLTATPPAGKTFAGWSGACTGSANTCVVQVNANLSAKASFNK
jgi:hypothetical protein